MYFLLSNNNLIFVVSIFSQPGQIKRHFHIIYNLRASQKENAKIKKKEIKEIKEIGKSHAERGAHQIKKGISKVNQNGIHQRESNA